MDWKEVSTHDQRHQREPITSTSGFETRNKFQIQEEQAMYVEHPYKFNDKFYAKVDGEFYEITKEVAKAMLSAYRNEIYRSRKWNPEDSKDVKRKTKRTEILDCVFSENVDGIGVEDLPDVMQRSVEDLVIMETEATELHKKIEKLSEQEQFIIKSIYFDGIKQVELAKLLGISKVRMSQKVNAILKKMRKMYEAEN
ncbi:sigma-70 family RNA polymerase sigma factor [Blautia obeum]|nr:sigma-70 family RNA polymerase sigma factor [Blautia obeum]